MNFDWRGFYEVALALRSETEEAKQRTAIGRAYYYVYNATKEVAEKLGFHEKAPSLSKIPGGVHNKLTGWCLKQPNVDLVALGDAWPQ